ncbi:DegT/DnrJ/EryC1/StrS family aminotransferase [Paenibacillus sp. H1-7]|uniref:DegT/DnrJ/EryC1/StrS family aminotransferase n=1 Tax=Paenibacillus sp. H1-7 TaxID=2282849 RepID=UPI001EF78CAA|nr:DegT/DnrJ/EryC1/StrS family aminotransferase [Paenibacillus sp. H1-7]ULL16049.1 DegT/DnrJ/EryC1/StrS family aminotransferase [Paenibacillus sp. H1-7]
MEKLAVLGGTPVRTKPFPSWPIYGEAEERLLLEVLHSGKWGGTGRVKLEALETEFAKLQDAQYAITTANGTIAITLALKAAGVQPGDEIILPPYTFIASATSVLLFGAIPVFVDVEADTLLLNPERIEAAITPRTKAIMAVHIAGCPADMDRINTIATKHGLAVIEDSAQAVGAKWNGVGVGALGTAGTFSFQSSKNINSGEGGMIVTNDRDVADMAWSITNVGRVRAGAWYQHEHIGWNFRMTEFQAAVLLGQMTRLQEQIQHRERNGLLLENLLGQIDGIATMRRDPRVTVHARHLFMFRVTTDVASSVGKEEIIRRLQAEGIPVAAGYVPLHRNAAVLSEIRKLTGAEPSYECPVCEQACANEVLWLHQNVLLAEEDDMRDIAMAVNKVMANLS